MRIVVDTNVLVSAALKETSVPAVALRLVEARCHLLKSVATEQELIEVLHRSRLSRMISPRFSIWLLNFVATAELVTISERFAACRDPKDDKFLELAVNGRADIVVSGDNDLLSLGSFKEIPILTPLAFVETVGREFGQISLV